MEEYIRVDSGTYLNTTFHLSKLLDESWWGIKYLGGNKGRNIALQ